MVIYAYWFTFGNLPGGPNKWPVMAQSTIHLTRRPLYSALFDYLLSFSIVPHTIKDQGSFRTVIFIFIIFFYSSLVGDTFIYIWSSRESFTKAFADNDNWIKYWYYKTNVRRNILTTVWFWYLHKIMMMTMLMMMMTMVDRSWVGALKCNGAHNCYCLLTILLLSSLSSSSPLSSPSTSILWPSSSLLSSSSSSSLLGLTRALYVALTCAIAVLPTLLFFSSDALITTTSSMQLKSTHATNKPTMTKKFQLWYVGAPQNVIVFLFGPQH